MKQKIGADIGNVDAHTRISAKKKTLTAMFKNVDKNKRKLAADLIDRAAFMAVTLENLEQSMLENGCADTYNNGGGQKGTKQNPDAKNYVAMMKTYTPVIGKLLEIVPPAPEKASKLEMLKKEMMGG